MINPPSCSGLVCNFSGVGSADSNVGDTFTYLWNFGDTAASTSTSSAPSHTFPAAGTYTVTLTTTDGWGKAKSVTRQVTVPTSLMQPVALTLACFAWRMRAIVALVVATATVVAGCGSADSQSSGLGRDELRGREVVTVVLGHETGSHEARRSPGTAA